MPAYLWACETENCLTTVEVFRRMDDNKIPPLKPCRTCEGECWKRDTNQYKKVTGAMNEDHNSSFPLRISGLNEKLVVDKAGVPVRDENGRHVKQYEDQVFNSRADQKAWLKERGMGLMMDGRSPSVSSSQHSFYDDKNPSNAPSANALKIAEQTTYIEPREVYDRFGVNTDELMAG